MIMRMILARKGPPVKGAACMSNPLGAFHSYWLFSALGKLAAIATIENLSLQIGPLSCERYQHDRKSRLGQTSRIRLPTTDNKFSMTNFQSRSPNF
jgi:hypothetical protein